MKWTVEFFDDFDSEFESFGSRVQNELLAHALMLEKFGPTLGRPYVDTLEGSRFSNMKELRFNVGGEVWRVAFAFDPKRRAVLLVGGDKSSANQKRFYKTLIKIADERFLKHLSKKEVCDGKVTAK